MVTQACGQAGLEDIPLPVSLRYYLDIVQVTDRDA
jgi:hypothetical protein